MYLILKKLIIQAQIVNQMQIYNMDNDDNDPMNNIIYSYNIWKTKKKCISMSYPTISDVLFDEWLNDNSNIHRKV